MREDLSDTKLPCIQIKKRDLGKVYPEKGYGDEAQIYKYKKDIAMKIFYNPSSMKFDKIEQLGRLEDEAILFPKGLVGYQGTFLKEGYYMQLVDLGLEVQNFDDLKLLYDLKRKLNIIKKTDAAIRRAHRIGVIIGDIKPNNILIDKNDNSFLGDTDNCKYGDYDFDIKPIRSSWLSSRYKNADNLEDNDKFVWGLLVLNTLLYRDLKFNYREEEMNNIIKMLCESKEAKETLEAIFSDAENKPYIGDVLEKLNVEGCFKK